MQSITTVPGSHVYSDPIMLVASDREASFRLLLNTRSDYKEVRQERDLSSHTAKWHPKHSTRAKHANIADDLDLRMARMRATCLDSVNRIEYCDDLLDMWDRDLREIDSCMDYLAEEELASEEERVHNYYEESYYESEFSGEDVTVCPDSFSTVRADPCDEVMCMTVGYKGANFTAITSASNVSVIWHEKSSGLIYVRSRNAKARTHAILLLCDSMRSNREIINARRVGTPLPSDRIGHRI